MYSPTTRLLTVLALLQSNAAITGAEIARRLEVDTRTVRRYITMLQDMGIPVEGERGPHGAYALGHSSKMPPLMFTEGEAVALTLGLLVMREFGFPVDTAAVEGALAKAQRVLPEKLSEQVLGLQEAITFDVVPSAVPPPSSVVAQVSVAVRHAQRLRLHYRAWDDGETERDFDAYGIVFYDGYWYTAGYCHLRKAIRTFRLDRIVALEPTDQTFDRPKDFDPLGVVRHSLASIPGSEAMRILIHAPVEAIRALMPPAIGTLEETPEGVILSPAAPDEEWIAYFLLTLEFPITVLESDALRERMRQLAARALQIADGVETRD